MPNVHFYLKKPEPLKDEKGKVIPWKMKKSRQGKIAPEYPDNARSLIYLQFKYSGQRIVFSFNQQINPNQWNENKQRVKSNAKSAASGDEYINDLLDSLERVCLNAYKKQISAGRPNPAVIQQALSDFVLGNDKEDRSLLNLIDRFVAGEILYKGKKRSAGTLKAYSLTKNRLLEFSRTKKIPVTYESINVDFYEKLVNYLRGKTHTDESTGKEVRTISDSSIGNTIKDLKTFMGVAVDRDYTGNMQFKKKAFAKLTEETDAVYLTWDEVFKLYRRDLSGNKTFEQVRDLFVFGCCIGLRYSDYSTVKPENIIQHEGEHYISMPTKKTGERVIIPCNPIVMEIFNKYQGRENRLPRTISNQKFNQYLKEICQKAGLIETGRLQTEPDLQLWECTSSHTARRSGLTNYYLEGVPVIDLMKISGHKTEKAFLTYIKVSKLEVAKRLGAHIKKNWSEKLLKVAV